MGRVLGLLRSLITKGAGFVPAPFSYGYTPAELSKELRGTKNYDVNLRAYRLLEENLTSSQLRELHKIGAFRVRGSMGGHYKITWKPEINIIDYNRSCTLCIVPNQYGIPTADVMLAQKLLIETNESLFLRMAIRYP